MFFQMGGRCLTYVLFQALGHAPQNWHQAGLFPCEDGSFSTHTRLPRKVSACPFDRWKDECTEKMVHQTHCRFAQNPHPAPFSPQPQRVVKGFSGAHFTAVRAEPSGISQGCGERTDGVPAFEEPIISGAVGYRWRVLPGRGDFCSVFFINSQNKIDNESLEVWGSWKLKNI